MGVRRVVPDLTVDAIGPAQQFYVEILGMRPVMDHGWIVMVADPADPTTLISLMTRDETAPMCPAAPIQFDDVDAANEAALRFGAEIVHPLTDEPWGVRRFFARDPAGNVVNIVEHR